MLNFLILNEKLALTDCLFLEWDGSNLLVANGAVPEGSEEDALHIGIAYAQGADYLLTWNFKHINNAETKAAITRLVESCGYSCPQLCSPEELGGMYDDQ